MPKSIYKILIVILIIAGISACATVGSPSGGPKDEIPPVKLGSKPLENSVNYHKNKIEIFFDEIVNVQNASDKVIVSPPQKKIPTVRGMTKKIVVELADSLLDNTTYTIDFTDAIVDYNENNPYGSYAFSFSTGPSIDTLCASGYVLDAQTLAPLTGIVVGCYANLDDSAFLRLPFERISKTDADGHFNLRNLKDSIPYHIFALGDQNRDYHFDQKGEPIGLLDSAITLWAERCLRNDTIWKDTVTVDTIVAREVTCFYPDDLIFKYFKEDFGRQYLVKSERLKPERFDLYFGYKSDSLPQLKLLAPDSLSQVLDSLGAHWYSLEKSPTNDTLFYWLADSALIRLDTLRIQIDYLKTDSSEHLSHQCDTLSLFTRKEKTTAKKTKENAKAKKSKEKVEENPHAVNIREIGAQIDSLRWQADSLNRLIPGAEPIAWLEMLPSYFQSDSLTSRSVPENASELVVPGIPEVMAEDSTATLAADSTATATDSAKEQCDKLLSTIQSLGKQWEKEKELLRKDSLPPVVYLNVSDNLGDKIDIFSRPTFVCETPLRDFDPGVVHLFFMDEDSTWTETGDYTLIRDENNIRRFHIDCDWYYGESFQITIDSMGLQSIYGFGNEKYKKEFSIKEEEEYARLILTVVGLEEGQKAIVELMNKSEEVLFRKAVEGETADCRNITPGEYFVRLFIDNNHDGKWTTGCYEEHRQPEPVYYLEKMLTLKANWDDNEIWNIHALPLERQRPQELRPQTDSSKKSGGRR